MNSPDPRTSPTSARRSTSGRSRSEQVRTDLRAACACKLLVLDDVQHRQSDRARDGVAAERAEELHPVGERRGDLRRRHHRPDRMAVADRFAEHDDVAARRPAVRKP